ncbi:MAG TPA: SCO4226 family nickel-binding protein [Kofleriaceae bacterium]|nr:SCO4226 family nickel-binding protein [Kofleriaceae bacterium]
MPKFMDVHTEMKGIDRDKLVEAHKADTDIEDSEGVRFLQAWADPVSGKVFCLSEGPNKEAIQRIHERAGHKADEIYEISLEV